MAGCGDVVAFTKDENVVDLEFFPNEYIQPDDERENYRDDQRGIYKQEHAPIRNVGSGRRLKT